MKDRAPLLNLILTVAILIPIHPGAGRAADDPHAGHAMHMGGAAPGDVPLYTDLGHWHRAVGTKSPAAQRYFDQGLTLVYSFNHEEAERAFREAAKLDPDCAACWWGVALSLGPHINVPALPPRTHAAAEAIRTAVALAQKARPLERELIEALAKRYVDPQPADPQAELAAETAYAEAMHAIHLAHPQDPDVATLYAEALMDLRPWDYWTPEGKPQPGTEEIVALLEGVLAKYPNHPGANHYYIHAVEASPHPERALASAKRLETLVPGVGHMVHMPSHTYLRLGRYPEAAQSNRDAIVSDDRFANIAHPQGFFLMYTAHNRQFLSCAAMLLGRREEAIASARSTVASLPLHMTYDMPGTDFFLTTPYLVLTQFARWDEMLKEPAPPADLPYMNGIWHYARGLASLGKDDVPAARRERDSLATIAANCPAAAMEDLNPSVQLLAIARNVLEARIAEREGRGDEAVAFLTRAVATEDSTRYSEPPDWLFPVRPELGAALLRAGRARDAELTYRADLERHPHNGWSLFGLAESLKAQNQPTASAKVETEFREAWKGADTELTLAGPVPR